MAINGSELQRVPLRHKVASFMIDQIVEALMPDDLRTTDRRGIMYWIVEANSCVR